MAATLPYGDACLGRPHAVARRTRGDAVPRRARRVTRAARPSTRSARARGLRMLKRWNSGASASGRPTATSAPTTPARRRGWSRSSATARSGSAARRGCPASARCWRRPRTSVVATGIVNVWAYEPAQLAAEYAALTRRLPGPAAARHRRRPPRGDERVRHAAGRRCATFLDGLDAAPDAGPARRALPGRAGAEDARPERRARARRDPVLHAGRAHALRARAARARRARGAGDGLRRRRRRASAPATRHASTRALYLGLRNYTNNLLRFGFTRGRHRRRRLRPADRRGRPARHAARRSPPSPARTSTPAPTTSACSRSAWPGIPRDEWTALAAALMSGSSRSRGSRLNARLGTSAPAAVRTESRARRQPPSVDRRDRRGRRRGRASTHRPPPPSRGVPMIVASRCSCRTHGRRRASSVASAGAMTKSHLSAATSHVKVLKGVDQDDRGQDDEGAAASSSSPSRPARRSPRSALYPTGGKGSGNRGHMRSAGASACRRISRSSTTRRRPTRTTRRVRSTRTSTTPSMPAAS